MHPAWMLAGEVDGNLLADVEQRGSPVIGSYISSWLTRPTMRSRSGETCAFARICSNSISHLLLIEHFLEEENATGAADRRPDGGLE